MLKRRKHLYHLVNRSSRAFVLSLYSFLFMLGFVFILSNLNPLFFKGDLFIWSSLFIGLNIYRWYNEVISESTFGGFHTIIVQLGLKIGFILFILSEIMLFFGFFWAFFHISISPDITYGLIWPPKGIITINPLTIPLYNTLLLLLSGFSLTWTHKSLNYLLTKDVIDSFIITIILGLFFIILQLSEYFYSSFSFNDSVYSCIFFMLTGLHGFHVFVGVSFITVCFIRLTHRHFTNTHHLGFLFCAWYWHFVDIVWIFLFIFLYLWGI